MEFSSWLFRRSPCGTMAAQVRGLSRRRRKVATRRQPPRGGGRRLAVRLGLPSRTVPRISLSMQRAHRTHRSRERATCSQTSSSQITHWLDEHTPLLNGQTEFGSLRQTFPPVLCACARAKGRTRARTCASVCARCMRARSRDVRTHRLRRVE